MKLNTEAYQKLLNISNDIIYDDKEDYTVADWLDCYGADIRSEKDEEANYNGFVTFGSPYAVAKMLRRYEKQVIRNVLRQLVVENEMNDKETC